MCFIGERGRRDERQQRRHLEVLCQQTSELFNEVRKACGKRKNKKYGKKEREREMKGIISKQQRGDRHHSEGQRKTKAKREG